MSKKAEDEATKKKAADDAAAAAKKVEDDAAAAAAKKAEEDKAGDDDEGKKKKPEKTFTKAELEAERQKAVAEAQKKWEEEKDLTELERIKKENEDLKAANRLRDAKDEVVEALKTSGAKAPELAFDAIQHRLKFDDAGKLVNSKDLIDNLKASYPDQFGVEKPEGSADGGAGQQGGGATKLTKEKLAAMSVAEIKELDWKEVSAVMSEK